MNTLPRISASQIIAFKKCPRLFYYQYRENRHRDNKNMSQLLGSALHRAIELYYKGRTNYTYEFQQYMQSCMEAWDDQNIKVAYEANFMRDLRDGKTFLKKVQWDVFKPIELEREFLLPFPSDNPIVMIKGVIDMICDDMLVDHKSNKEKPNKQELAHHPQFIIYYWAHNQLFGKFPDHVYWHHLRTGKLIEATIADNYANKIAQLTTDIQALLATQIFHRKEQDSFCRKNCGFYQKCFGELALPDDESE